MWRGEKSWFAHTLQYSLFSAVARRDHPPRSYLEPTFFLGNFFLKEWDCVFEDI